MSDRTPVLEVCPYCEATPTVRRTARQIAVYCAEADCPTYSPVIKRGVTIALKRADYADDGAVMSALASFWNRTDRSGLLSDRLEGHSCLIHQT